MLSNKKKKPWFPWFNITKDFSRPCHVGRMVFFGGSLSSRVWGFQDPSILSLCNLQSAVYKTPQRGELVDHAAGGALVGWKVACVTSDSPLSAAPSPASPAASKLGNMGQEEGNKMDLVNA